jgi:nucleotide-binding universal stress UspA family protein
MECRACRHAAPTRWLGGAALAIVSTMAERRTRAKVRIVVGVDGSPRSEDAVSFADRLAAVTGAELALLAAFAPGTWFGCPANRALGEQTREVTQKKLTRMRGLVDGKLVTTHASQDRSPARALRTLAERTRAALIVVGSTHRGRAGRVLPGSVAERLLHRAPCPVAIVPVDYRKRDFGHVRVVGVGFDGSEESREALNAASEIARGLRAQLRVVRVFDASWDATPALVPAGHGYVAVHRRLERRAREDLKRLVAGLPAATVAEGLFPPGRPARELVAQSEGVDLLVLGARAHGPLRTVLSPGVSRIVLRDAACPVIVVPRAARATLGELFAPACETKCEPPVRSALSARDQGWTSPRRIA